MQISNPLQMNDWEIKKSLGVVLAIHLAMWGVIGLDAMGLHIPIIREIIGFSYLTLIPGILILRIFRLHKLGSTKTFLFSIGLSVAFIMLIGLLMNTIYPYIGIAKPLSTVPLIATLSIAMLVLCTLSYIRDKDFSKPDYIDISRTLLTAPVLILILLPLLSILGTSLVNFNENNLILLLLMVMIATVGVLIGFNRFIGERLYPLAIITIAIALLYHNSLISSYLIGTDIQYEYYFYQLVEINSSWNPGIVAHSYNTVLSITILPVIYSGLMDMEGIQIFKVVYPLLFSLVPLALYQVVREQTYQRMAFWAAFLLIGFFGFFGEMLQSGKTQIALLFLALLILVMVDKQMGRTKAASLLIMFGISLTVSHYTLAYIYILYLVSAWLLLMMVKVLSRRLKRFSGLTLVGDNTEIRMLTGTWVALSCVVVISWYIYISQSVSFNMLVNIGDYVANAVLTEFLNPELADPRVLQTLGVTPLGIASWQHETAGWLNRITYLLIVVGVLKFTLHPGGMKFRRGYVALAYIGLGTLLAAVLFPRFHLGISRTYLVALLFLAPFCIIGGETIIAGISRVFQRASRKIKETIGLNRAYPYITLLLIAYFLFNVSFVFEVTGDVSYSASLSQRSIKTSDNAGLKAALYNVYHTDADMAGIRWLSQYGNKEARVNADRTAQLPLIGHGMIANEFIGWLEYPVRFGTGSYIYLNTLNTRDGVLVGSKEIERGLSWGGWIIPKDISTISPILEQSNKIYSNGGSEVCYISPE